MQLTFRHFFPAWRTLAAGVLIAGVLIAGVLGLPPGAGPLAADAAAAAPTHRPAKTTSVELERSGGFLGVTEIFTVTPTSADPRTARLMALTSGHRFRSLNAEYLPEATCCDRYRYRIVVRYADGTGKTVTTVDDTLSAPWVLREVISLALPATADTSLEN